jgi:hypothetical protein
VKTRSLPAVTEEIRELLRERRYAEAADLAAKVAGSLGIEERSPTPPRPVAAALTTERNGTETVGSRMAAIFENGKEGP